LFFFGVLFLGFPLFFFGVLFLGFPVVFFGVLFLGFLVVFFGVLFLGFPVVCGFAHSQPLHEHLCFASRTAQEIPLFLTQWSHVLPKHMLFELLQRRSLSTLQSQPEQSQPYSFSN
jgi:polyferredoxin